MTTTAATGSEFRYGDVPGGGRNTIHGSHHVDVEIGPDGHVVGVWFRCAVVPFAEHRVDADRADSMRRGYVESPPPPLKAIVIGRAGA